MKFRQFMKLRSQVNIIEIIGQKLVGQTRHFRVMELSAIGEIARHGPELLDYNIAFLDYNIAYLP